MLQLNLLISAVLQNAQLLPIPDIQIAAYYCGCRYVSFLTGMGDALGPCLDILNERSQTALLMMTIANAATTVDDGIVDKIDGGDDSDGDDDYNDGEDNYVFHAHICIVCVSLTHWSWGRWLIRLPMQ